MASRYPTPWSASRGWLPEPLSQVQREIDRVFDEVFNAGGASGRSAGSMVSAPRIDVHEQDGELRVHADLPGVAPSDIDIRVEGDVLTIRGERKSENERSERNFHVMERSHGSFQRSIQLPFAPDPDEVQATMREGVLELRIPKHAAQERSRRIQVRGAEGSSSASGGGASITQAVGGGGAGQEHERSSASTGSSAGGAGASGGGSSGSGGSAERGNVGQGPGGSSSVAPGTGSGAQGGDSGGLAGVAGGPTAVPAGQSSSSSGSPR
jgi:HSP20 family protein